MPVAVWDDTLAAAKKEGKVAVVGSPDPVMRNEVIPAFEKRHGIKVDYIAGRSAGSAFDAGCGVGCSDGFGFR